MRSGAEEVGRGGARDEGDVGELGSYDTLYVHSPFTTGFDVGGFVAVNWRLGSLLALTFSLSLLHAFALFSRYVEVPVASSY